jgi:hypothetical protein
MVSFPEDMDEESVAYWHSGIQNVVSTFESLAGRTCDVCGEKGEIVGGGWLSARCEKHVDWQYEPSPWEKFYCAFGKKKRQIKKFLRQIKPLNDK